MHGAPLRKGVPRVPSVIVTYYTMWLYIGVCYSAGAQNVSSAFAQEEQEAQRQGEKKRPLVGQLLVTA